MQLLFPQHCNDKRLCIYTDFICLVTAYMHYSNLLIKMYEFDSKENALLEKWLYIGKYAHKR